MVLIEFWSVPGTNRSRKSLSGRYSVPIGIQDFLSCRFPVPIGIQDFFILPVPGAHQYKKTFF